MATVDIILEENADIIVENGDFKVGDNDNNLIRYIVEAIPGQYKEFPVLGINITKYLNAPVNPQTLQRNIRTNLEADVFTRPLIDVNDFPTVVINKTELTLDNG